MKMSRMVHHTGTKISLFYNYAIHLMKYSIDKLSRPSQGEEIKGQYS